MTEYKRFALREPVIDNDIGCSEIADNGHWISYGEIVDLLNELHEENTRLKEQLKCEKQLFTKKQLHEENQHIKHLIKQAYNNERTTLGRNVLKQLIEQME